MRGLGFSDNEVKVYIALLKIGRSKAGRIAKECNITLRQLDKALWQYSKENQTNV